jgi:putative PIN family toxin of toxin-antitoxin system
VRAVLDANVLISAILSPRGTPARLLHAWQAGEFDLVISPWLLAELRRALAYPKLERLVPAADADAFVAWIRRSGVLAVDPEGEPPVHAVGPNDDYLLALAAAERGVLVSGDAHLTVLADRFPVRTPAAFLAQLRPVLPIPADQRWFWTERWQAMEREVDEHVAAGRVTVVDAPDALFAHLDTSLTS